MQVRIKNRIKGAVKRAARTMAPGVWERAYARFRLTNYRRAGVALCHIPKNGGSFICSRLYGRNLGHIPAAQIVRELAAAGHRDVPVIAFVQDPVRRFASGASHFFSRGGEHSVLSWRKSYEAIDTLPALIAYVAALPDAELDPIFRSQHHYLADAARLAAQHRIDFRFFPLAQLDAVLAEFSPGDLAAAPKARANRSGRTARYRRELDADEELRRKVREIYRDDLRYLTNEAT